MQPVSLSQSMQLFPCTHHQICSRSHAANITQLKHKAVACTQYQIWTVAMQPKSLSSNIQLLHAHENWACSCCYVTNITQLKHAAVAMHTKSNMQPLLCNQYTQLKHAAVAMHTTSNMRPLPCNQYHSAKACSHCHAHNIKHAVVSMQLISPI